MKPVGRFQAERVRTLRAGALQGILLLIVLRAHGMTFPWLVVVVIGMMLAMRVLTLALMCQAGVISPWRRFS